MIAKVFSGAILGIEGRIIEIEIDVSFGLRHFSIVGLPDKAVEEAKERVCSALKSCGFTSPHQKPFRVLVSLAPADLKKEGSLYDLPLAIGFLLASQQINFLPEKKLIIGELSLDGRVRAVKGALALGLLAKEKGFKEIILPWQNLEEVSVIKEVRAIGVKDLKEAVEYLQHQREIPSFEIDPSIFFNVNPSKEDFCVNWIKGQEMAKRALEICAAGGHHLMMQGPPGTGKTLLAKALPSLLPPLSLEEALEVTKIYSVCGILPKDTPLITKRPFRAPHHTCSEVALIGGGNPPRPGEITLAHRGVLFLDEFPEFHRDVLESLRQPLEEGFVSILRSKYRVTFPSKFTLVGAANPCPCGYYGDPEKECTCTSSQIRMYQRKLKGPLMDRIDVFVNVSQIEVSKLEQKEQENIFVLQERIKKARQIQKERFEKEKILLNSEMQPPQIEKYCEVDPDSKSLLWRWIDSRKISLRGYHKVLKVARTIADLEQSEKILKEHVLEALGFRQREEF